MFISIALLSPIDLLNRLDWLTIVMKPGKPFKAGKKDYWYIPDDSALGSNKENVNKLIKKTIDPLWRNSLYI